MLRFLRGKPAKFEPRSIERDRENDGTRFDRIFRALEEASESLSQESEGLRQRYEAAQTDASMMLFESESEGISSAMNQRLGRIEQSVVYYETRMGELGRQRAALETLRKVAREALPEL